MVDTVPQIVQRVQWKKGKLLALTLPHVHRAISKFTGQQTTTKAHPDSSICWKWSLLLHMYSSNLHKMLTFMYFKFLFETKELNLGTLNPYLELNLGTLNPYLLCRESYLRDF
jgi:hypothetical protein